MDNSKVFIIGLPRTGTTSVCVAFLNLGYRVAHCALTERSLLTADVVGDTPAYADYRMLDERFPQSRFIYLDRKIESWLLSIKSLLANMIVGLTTPEGGFHPIVRRCYSQIFHPITAEYINSDAHLRACYECHRAAVFEYFHDRRDSFLAISLDDANSYSKLTGFLEIDGKGSAFPKMNTEGRIVSWREIQHPNKVRFNL